MGYFNAIFYVSSVIYYIVQIQDISAADNCTRQVCKLNKDILKFFLLGDWGGIPIWPYYTYGQTRVANAIGQMANEQQTDFQMALGDNFYIIGVKTAEDKRFKRTFENVYNHDYLTKTPWYGLLGNHDHNGNVQAQIDYSKKSNRWTMPSLYYTINYELKNGTKVEFILIDTVVLCGQTKDGQFDSTLKYIVASSSKADGPSNIEEAEEQWRWIESRLQASQANYLFVVGHYPIYSVAEHGPTQCLIEKLNPLLLNYNVTAYLSGHDHNLQHLQIFRNNSRSQPLHYVLSGAGAFMDASVAHENDVPRDSLQFSYPSKRWYNFITAFGFTRGGFVYTSITPRRASFKYYSGKSELLHEFDVKPRF